MPKGQTLEERMDAKTRKGKHWYWTGAARADGVGVVWYRGRMEQARRVWWVLEHEASLENGQTVEPTCGESLCINPAHMEAQFKPTIRNGLIYPEYVA